MTVAELKEMLEDVPDFAYVLLSTPLQGMDIRVRYNDRESG